VDDLYVLLYQAHQRFKDLINVEGGHTCKRVSIGDVIAKA
jgi:hypothetical protein